MQFRPGMNPASLVFACWAAGWAGHAAVGFDVRLSRSVPADAIAVVLVDATSRDGPSTTLNSLDLARIASDGGYQLGLLTPVDESVRCWIDSLAALSVALRYRFALVLMDVAARPRADGGHELFRLSAAFIAETGGDDAALEQRIAHLLRAYTNSEESTVQTHHDGDRTWYVLRDRRLADWAEITWGTVGERYLITIGPGSRERAIRALSGGGGTLNDDAWFGAAFRNADGKDAAVAAYVNFEQLEETADEALRKKVHAAMAGLGLGDASRTLFTFAKDDQSIEIRALARIGASDELHPLAGARFAETSGIPVPKEATGFAAIHWEPVRALRGACRAYLSARSAGARDRARRFWRTLQAEAGTSIEGDVFAQLGPVILVHNYPEHAFRLPLAWTIVIPIEGNAETVRQSVDKLLGYTSRELIPEHSAIGLRRDADGIWYLSFGLAGPAIAVTDRQVVVSFSPEAVRRNLELLESESSAP